MARRLRRGRRCGNGEALMRKVPIVGGRARWWEGASSEKSEGEARA